MRATNLQENTPPCPNISLQCSSRLSIYDFRTAITGRAAVCSRCGQLGCAVHDICQAEVVPDGSPIVADEDVGLRGVENVSLKGLESFMPWSYQPDVAMANRRRTVVQVRKSASGVKSLNTTSDGDGQYRFQRQTNRSGVSRSGCIFGRYSLISPKNSHFEIIHAES